MCLSSACLQFQRHHWQACLQHQNSQLQPDFLIPQVDLSWLHLEAVNLQLQIIVQYLPLWVCLNSAFSFSKEASWRTPQQKFCSSKCFGSIFESSKMSSAEPVELLWASGTYSSSDEFISIELCSSEVWLSKIKRITVLCTILSLLLRIIPGNNYFWQMFSSGLHVFNIATFVPGLGAN